MAKTVILLLKNFLFKNNLIKKICKSLVLVVLPGWLRYRGQILVFIFREKKVGPGPDFTLGPDRFLAIAN